jgi:hypothetical protein
MTTPLFDFPAPSTESLAIINQQKQTISAAIQSFLNSSVPSTPNTAPTSPDVAPILSQLESHVLHQVQYHYYDSAANRFLVELYSFYPDKIRMHILNRVMAKALLEEPSLEFAHFLYVLDWKNLFSSSAASGELTNSLIKIQKMWENGTFRQFWTYFSQISNPASKDTFFDWSEFRDDFEIAARRFILINVSHTFSSINAQTLRDFFNIPKSASFESIIASLGWKIVEGEDSTKYVELKPYLPLSVAAKMTQVPSTTASKDHNAYVSTNISFYRQNNPSLFSRDGKEKNEYPSIEKVGQFLE